MVDAHGLGPCPLWVGVRVSPSAPETLGFLVGLLNMKR